MRLAALLIMLVFPVTPPLRGQQASVAQSTHDGSTATLQETTQWLESHLVGVSSVFDMTTIDVDSHGNPIKTKKNSPENTPTVFHYTDTVTAAKIDNCLLVMSVREVIHTGRGAIDTVWASKVPLDRMKGASWSERKIEPTVLQTERTTRTPSTFNEILLNTSEKISFSSVTKTKEDGKTDSSVTDPDDKFSIVTDDSSIASRLVNAFNHAIKICRASAKPEPF